MLIKLTSDCFFPTRWCCCWKGSSIGKVLNLASLSSWNSQVSSYSQFIGRFKWPSGTKNWQNIDVYYNGNLFVKLNKFNLLSLTWWNLWSNWVAYRKVVDSNPVYGNENFYKPWQVNTPIQFYLLHFNRSYWINPSKLFNNKIVKLHSTLLLVKNWILTIPTNW